MLPVALQDYLEALLSGSRKGIYKIWRALHRKLGGNNTNTEALHRTGKERFDAPAIDYNPKNVATYLSLPAYKIADE